jgi:hypothetical protein
MEKLHDVNKNIMKESRTESILYDSLPISHIKKPKIIAIDVQKVSQNAPSVKGSSIL